MEPLQIVIGCEPALVQRGLCSIMADASDIVVVGEVGAHTDLRRLVEQTAPDVLVLDVEILGCQSTPGDVWLQALPVPVLIVTGCQDDETIAAWVQAGVTGYLLLEEPTERIVAAVRGVARGERAWFSRRIAEVLAGRTEREALVRLTAREQAVLGELAAGATNEEIGEALAISVHTVRHHLKNAYRKLGVESRSQAVVWAIRHGLGGG